MDQNESPSEPISQSHVAHGSARRKRTVTLARKEQNRVAQKAFRQRRKESLRQVAQAAKQTRDSRRTRELRPLPSVAVSASPNVNTENCPRGAASLQPDAGHRPFSSALGAPGPAAIPDPDMILAFAGPGLTAGTGASDAAAYQLSQAPSCVPSISTVDSWNLDSLLGPSSSTALVDSSSSQDSDDTSGLSRTCTGSRGRHGLAGPTNASTGNAASAGEVSLMLADPIVNKIQFAPVTLFSAMMENALNLGFDITRMLTTDYVSPFYRPVSPRDDPGALLAGARRPSAPAHMQPTLPQIMYPHHPYMDLLPYPGLRARLIVLTALMPHAFDQFDFKADVYLHGGLVCWETNGSARPWDMRSWEAAPWFLDKWKMLLSGDGGEIWKHSSWWWGLRARNSGAN